MTRDEHATAWIDKMCKEDIEFKKTVELLDKYDFSEFLSDGRSLNNLLTAIEEKYEKEFWDKYQSYMFDALAIDDIYEYFISRYNIWFQEYTDWVVRHDNGTYEKTRRRA